MIIYLYLTPLIPLSFKGEGEIKKEGEAPLRHPVRLGYSFQERLVRV